jgi:hypothetical protein
MPRIPRCITSEKSALHNHGQDPFVFLEKGGLRTHSIRASQVLGKLANLDSSFSLSLASRVAKAWVWGDSSLGVSRGKRP